MGDAKVYCDKTYKRLIALKSGLYDVIVEAEKVSDQAHGNQARQLKTLVDSIEKGLDELSTQCPPDWSPKKQELDDSMDRLAETLSEVADRLGIAVPDTTAWI